MKGHTTCSHMELVVQKYPNVSNDKIDLKDAGIIPFGSTISSESN
jgi:hypothetical protein